MPRLGQNCLRRLVRRTSRPSSSSVTLSTSAGMTTRRDLATRLPGWCELRRATPMTPRARERRVIQLETCLHAAQHEATPAHVAAADEVRWEHQAITKDGQEQIHVLAGGDAAEQHDLTV